MEGEGGSLKDSDATSTMQVNGCPLWHVFPSKTEAESMTHAHRQYMLVEAAGSAGWLVPRLVCLLHLPVCKLAKNI